MKKGLLCAIYESKGFGNCSNYGISARCKQVVLVPNELFPNIPQIFEAADDAPAVEFHKIEFMDKTFYHVKPVELGNRHSMFGGSFIYTSDSRFPFDHPVKLHDRVE